MQKSTVSILQEDQPIFSSHFPGNPVYPGVCVCAAMEDFCQSLLPANEDHVLQEITQAKFRKPLLPNDSYFIECEEVEPKTYQCKLSRAEDSQVVSTARLKFQKSQDLKVVSGQAVEPQTLVTNEEVLRFLPHGPHIRTVDTITRRTLSERALAKLENGERRQIIFPDLEGSKISSFFRLKEDFYLLNKKELRLAYQAEAVAQCGAFLVYGIKPEEMDIELTLLSFSAELKNRIHAPATLEAHTHLVQARGSEAKGYMNFFDGSVTCDGLTIATFRFNAMARYTSKPKSK